MRPPPRWLWLVGFLFLGFCTGLAQHAQAFWILFMFALGMVGSYLVR